MQEIQNNLEKENKLGRFTIPEFKITAREILPSIVNFVFCDHFKMIASLSKTHTNMRLKSKHTCYLGFIITL